MKNTIIKDEVPYSHVYKDFRHLVDYPDKERLDFINEVRWVNYEVADDIILELDGLLNFPKRLRMPNLLIVGDPNNGKTSIAHRFFRKHGLPVEENGILIKPVIFANAPSSTNEKDLYMSILEALHMPYRTKDSASSLLYQVLHLCQEYQVKMIMIDELHSLLTGTPRQQRQIMNGIKTLCNELKIPIVGIGTQDAKRVLHTDPQHASRFGIVEVPLWKLDKNFQKLLFRLEAVFPLKNPSELHGSKKAALIHTISNGNLGNIHRLLSVCARDAIVNGTEQITEDSLTKNKDVRLTEGLR
jgi:Cdc6-like AAA superfamily ATPase